MIKLYIGNKRYSSWSLRPWLILKYFNIPFEEQVILLDKPDTLKNILATSPSGKVPCLTENSILIWDSLAIAEYLNEKYPEKQMWPSDLQERARARSISCEMHSGFLDMRKHMSHDLQKRLTNFDSSACDKDIARIKSIWSECLQNSKGPFLFKNFSIADAMFAPVVNRFISYGIPIEPTIENYVNHIRQLPAHQQWITAGEIENF
jgi:glutathione S-transferase